MKFYTALPSALALCECVTGTQARSSYTTPSNTGLKLDFDLLRNRKGHSSDVKQGSYDVLEMLDDGFLLIQGLLVRGESPPKNQLTSWPGQDLDWNGDVRTNIELNMMGI